MRSYVDQMTSFNFGKNVNDDQFGLFSEPKKPEKEIVEDNSIPIIVPNDNIEQVALIEKGEWWENHWKGMPEYKSEDLMPFKTIYVHFRNRADMEKFAKVMEQTLTLDTQSIWYPELEIQDLLKKKYVDTK
jgi:hypothetical protein